MVAADDFTLEGLVMRDYSCVSDVARRIGAHPKDISDLFYRRILRDEVCPIIGGRRLIPESYVPEIARVLQRRARQAGPVTGPCAQGAETTGAAPGSPFGEEHPDGRRDSGRPAACGASMPEGERHDD